MWFSNSKPNSTDSKYWYFMLNENNREGQPYCKSTTGTTKEDDKRKMRSTPISKWLTAKGQHELP